MKRRNFLTSALAVTAAAVAGSIKAETTGTVDGQTASGVSPEESKKPFKLLYAPHFGLFEHSAGKDLVAQLQFMADNGFMGLEDNGMKKRSTADQNRIAAEMQRLGMTMGVFVAHGDFGSKTFVHKKPEITELLRREMHEAVELSKRVNAKWCTVVLDQFDPALDWGYQTANAIDNLRTCAEICEPAGLTMVLEPLNKRDHAGLFLTGVPQAYEICRAVNSPACKILDDLYHQQITEGNLIPNIDAAWSEIAYFQIGDNPGRKEPTTGEINYKNIFKHIHNKGFKGVMGMEHGKKVNSKEGEQALIAAYRESDSF